MKRHEREAIINALKQSKGKVSGRGGAAELLGLKPTTLASRISALGLNPKMLSGSRLIIDALIDTVQGGIDPPTQRVLEGTIVSLVRRRFRILPKWIGFERPAASMFNDRLGNSVEPLIESSLRTLSATTLRTIRRGAFSLTAVASHYNPLVSLEDRFDAKPSSCPSQSAGGSGVRVSRAISFDAKPDPGAYAADRLQGRIASPDRMEWQQYSSGGQR